MSKQLSRNLKLLIENFRMGITLKCATWHLNFANSLVNLGQIDVDVAHEFHEISRNFKEESSVVSVNLS